LSLVIRAELLPDETRSVSC